MENKYVKLLKSKMNQESYYKLEKLNNKKLFDFIGQYIELCDPETVYMCNDSQKDNDYIRFQAIEKGEEKRLVKSNQTIHYDGYGDQARDKGNTKFMVSKENLKLMGKLNCTEFNEGFREILDIARGIMRGKEAIVKLYCECPPMSPFAIGCAQITDSLYVAHSENILYRGGYRHFMEMEDKNDFFRFVHSAGEVDENGCSVNLKNRRIYQDIENFIVYSMNAQYAGNSVGLKKHAMRLAIKKSSQEGWLCEHMFIGSIQNSKKNRATYFCGAFPSACGKTATAMIDGEKIVGDDIAYFRNINGEFRAANVECGIFGIIKDVNAKDDPVIYKTLQMDKEMIFSNVLTGSDDNAYWQGMGIETPNRGKNHSGKDWIKGKKDSTGKEIPIAHSNSRYTIRLDYLENLDPAWNDKNGVEVSGIVYGGRDSNCCVPVEESFDWQDGIINKACTLESETTSATLGQEGVLVPQPMANLDFISYPIGQYIQNNIDFVKAIKKVPRIFAVNYFLKDSQGDYCNSKLAKKVWLHWAEMRVHDEVSVIKTPTGYIPEYEILRELFKEILDEEYSVEEYHYQFSFRCQAWIDKLARATDFFKTNVPDCLETVFSKWQNTIRKIKTAQTKFGDSILPGKYNE